MVCLFGVFISGVTLQDQELVNGILYSLGGSREKPTGGFLDCFNPASPTCLRDDCLWGADPKPEDQIASLAIMISVAEVMWPHGVDLYGYRDMALKKPFDAGLSLILPSAAAPSDAGYAKRPGLPGVNAYAYAFRWYQDARYLPLINQLKPALVLAVGELPSGLDVRTSGKLLLVATPGPEFQVSSGAASYRRDPGNSQPPDGWIPAHKPLRPEGTSAAVTGGAQMIGLNFYPLVVRSSAPSGGGPSPIWRPSGSEFQAGPDDRASFSTESLGTRHALS